MKLTTCFRTILALLLFSPGCTSAAEHFGTEPTPITGYSQGTRMAGQLWVGQRPIRENTTATYKVLPGAHYDVYTRHYAEASNLAILWFREHLN